MIRVREREVLNFSEQVRTEIFGKALTGHGGAACAQNTAGHGAAGNDDHDDADCQNEAVAVCDKCLRKQLAQNLRWGNANATQEQLREACAIACADEFIDRFPGGYETVLEQNAANLSGGQKQRLRIARAIVKQPKILILDDSTSAVDMATDEHIRRALKTAMPGSTKIIIAQRIASILSCDRIIVLHEGELSDVGTHAELMERSQIYRDVYDSQMREEGEQHGQS